MDDFNIERVLGIFGWLIIILLGGFFLSVHFVETVITLAALSVILFGCVCISCAVRMLID